MKMMKKLFAFMLVLCMVLSLCACGGNSEKDDDTQKDNVENTQTDNDESKDEDVESEDVEGEDETATTPVFKVTVVDEAGNPVQGVMVQVCKEICLPAITDAEGVATISLEIEEGHKLQVSSCPEGYVYEGEAEVYLEAGQTEATITVKAVQ